MQRVTITAKDGAVISAAVYPVEDAERKGAVVISHGFGEHSGSYTELAEVLQKQGYASVIPDQRGHGALPEGVKKWFGIIADYQCFTDDIVSVTEYINETMSGTPLVLFGHSMGGNIVINTLLRNDLKCACAVYESPWLGLYDPPAALTVCFVRLLNRIAPKFTIANKLRHSDISSDSARADKYAKDPLYHNFISMRMLTGIMDACKYALSNAGRLKVPSFMAYAENERIVCNRAILNFAADAGEAVIVKRYPSNHAIHNDVDHAAYFNDILEFIKKHCEGS